jgi:dihydroxyacid dehydratase/phosphogluconate dehydratase
MYRKTARVPSRGQVHAQPPREGYQTFVRLFPYLPVFPSRHLTPFPCTPSDILTRQSFENAIAVVNVIGGSTNSVLHLLAIARSAGVDLSTADFERIAEKTPVLCDLKPSGKYVMEGEPGISLRTTNEAVDLTTALSPFAFVHVDLHAVGGIPSILKYLLRNTDLIDGSQLTVTGQTLAENVESGAHPSFPLPPPPCPISQTQSGLSSCRF